MTDNTTWCFNALDTWFFRESRPHDAVGGSQLSSLFPPPARTIAGAIRTLIGEANNVDWQDFAQKTKNHAIYKLIGYGDDMGPIKLNGPWLCHDGQRLYPVPTFLMATTEGGQTSYTRLKIGPPAQCDIGTVRLPVLKDKLTDTKYLKKPKSLEKHWLTETGLNAILLGECPVNSDIIEQKKLFKTEARLGIARDNEQRTAIDNLLYQTVHIRPKDTLSVEVDVAGIDKNNLPDKNQLIRLGGEARLTAITVKPVQNLLPKIEATSDNRNLILILLTAAAVDNQQGLPDGFKPSEQNGSLTWDGEINNVGITIYSAVVGKAQREGGWDLAKQQPREVQSLIPAGSAWYCSINDGININDAINALHGSQIGKDKALGRGQLAVGLWPQHEFCE